MLGQIKGNASNTEIIAMVSTTALYYFKCHLLLLKCYKNS